MQGDLHVVRYLGMFETFILFPPYITSHQLTSYTLIAVAGVEVSRASATRKNQAKKIAAYKYLRSTDSVHSDAAMDALV